MTECIEPLPPDAHWPRYSQQSFPPYRFLPGRTPHPRRDSKGHSYGRQEPKPESFSPHQWQASEWYLYAVDLYNFAYWWECHEVFEGLWNAVGRESDQGQCFQGLIQVASANLKRFLCAAHAADRLWRRGLERLRNIPAQYMGMNVLVFSEDVRAYFEGTRQTPALIRLPFAL